MTQESFIGAAFKIGRPHLGEIKYLGTCYTDFNQIRVFKPSKCMKAAAKCSKSGIYKILFNNNNIIELVLFCKEDIDFGVLGGLDIVLIDNKESLNEMMIRPNHYGIRRLMFSKIN
nr:uncharacterized protein LOC118682957 [Bactrocera oleae]